MNTFVFLSRPFFLTLIPSPEGRGGPHPLLFPPGRTNIVYARSAGKRSTGPFPVSASPPVNTGEGELVEFSTLAGAERATRDFVSLAAA